jgi:CubicO group peptidase (beta-lactamase class C family)
VDPENWQDSQDHRLAFWQAGALPPKRIPRAEVTRKLDVVLAPVDVGAVQVDRVDGTSSRVSSILSDTYTDACVVLQDGAVVFENYGKHGGPQRRQALMSVSKSIVGCVAAILIERGDLDPERPLTDYVSELQDSGYRGATVRHVLDMRSGVRFSEEYTNPVAEIRELDRWIGWSERTGAGGPHGLYPYLLTLQADAPHGGELHYRSAETDVLGWVCERASGSEMAQLLSSLVWQPMGAEHNGGPMLQRSGRAEPGSRDEGEENGSAFHGALLSHS